MGAQGAGQRVRVEEGLEAAVCEVESAVVTYLVRIDDASSAALMAALRSLDAHTAASEDFQRRQNSFTSLTGVAGLGKSGLDVFGQTSDFPTVNEVPVQVFQAQVALVRAAKEGLAAPSPTTLDALSIANDELAAARSQSWSETPGDCAAPDRRTKNV